MSEDAVPLKELRRALVIKLRHHGDVLLASPVLSVLKTHAPQAEIDALVYADTAAMLAGHPALAQLHVIDREWKSRAPWVRARAELALLAALRARGYDLLVHLTEHNRGAWLARLLAPRWAVAPAARGRLRVWRRSFTHLAALPLAGGRHVVESDLDVLRRIGIQPGPQDRRLVLVPGDAADRRVENLMAERGIEARRFIHFHPASRWRFKCWTVEGMAAVAAALRTDGWQIVLTAAPEAAEHRMIGAIQDRLGSPAASFAGELSLKELAALSARARLFVGVDSAPMHIAAAMGTPVVAIFGPSGEKNWAPWGVPHRVVASDRHGCRPCGIDGCGGGKLSDCLVSLEAGRVIAAARELLATAA